MKRYHIVSIVLLTVSIILGITSIVGPSVPWSRFIEPTSNTCSIDADCPVQQTCNPAGLCISPGTSPIYRTITLGLLQETYCQGTSDLYSNEDPKSCRLGGKAIAIISSVGVVLSFVGMIFTILRAKAGIAWRCAAIISPALSSILFLSSWAYWLSGCHNALTQANHEFTVSAGFALSVICWLFASFSSIIQGFIREPNTDQVAYSKHSRVESHQLKDFKAGPLRVSESIEEPEKEKQSDLSMIIPPSYTPRPRDKNLHWVTIVFLIVAIICGGISVSSQAVPWTKFERTWKDTYGEDPPNADSVMVIIRAGLLRWEMCFGETTHYGEYDPAACQVQGKYIMGISSFGIITAFIAISAVYARGRGHHGAGLKATCLFSSLISSIAFFVSWAIWSSHAGCPHEVEFQYSIKLSFSVGWSLTVSASALVLFAFILQTAGVCLPTSIPYRDVRVRGGPAVKRDGGEGYVGLLDEEVPYL